MMFVLRMWWREVRTSWARLSFFFLSVAIGVAAIVALRSVTQTVRFTLTSQARTLVGADLVVQSQRPLTGEIRTKIDGLLQSARVSGTTEMIETQTMAAPVEGTGNGQVKLVEIRGVEAAFPYYGTLELEGGAAYSHALVANHGVLVQPELLVALDLKSGDALRLAGQTFTIRGVVVKDPSQRAGIAFGPRVYVDLADLRTTSLFGFGSRASYQLMVRADDATTTSLRVRLRDALKQDAVTVRSWQALEDRIGENLRVAENYLSLVGFAIVVLGGIGVWSVTRVIVQQKMRSVAILKCIGATSGRVLSIYVLQVLSLALGGGVLGVVMAAAGLSFIPPAMLQSLNVTSVEVTASAVLQGLAVGVLVSMLFALVPLLDIRRVKPLLLLRAGSGAVGGRHDWPVWGAGVGIGLALTAVAVWQADSIRAGVFAATGLGVVAAALYGAGRLLIRLTRPMVNSPVFAVRHAVISLGRPGNQTRVVLMAVGLGCFFVMGVRALQSNLLDHLTRQVGANSPDFVLIDVQPDQVASITTVVEPFLRATARITPLLRGRVVAVAGAKTNLPTRDAVRDQGTLTREFGLTFRSGLEPNEAVTAGQFWTSPLTDARLADGADTEVSVEREAARGARLEVGDRMTFDIAGRLLVARVSSIRTVKWNDSQNGGFVFVLRPGPAAEQTAHSYVGFIQVRDDQAARGQLQRDVVRTHPNVSVINVRDVLASVKDVVANVSLGVTVVGAVTLLGGVLILIGAVAMTKFQRVYDAAIYRTLGASTRVVAAMVAVEYAVLGALSGGLGAIGALALSWGLARFLFEIEWQPAFLMLTLGVTLVTVAVSAVGVVASLDVLFRKPLATLRGE